MKIKKLISSALLVVILFSAVSVLIPAVVADAAYIQTSTGSASLTKEEIEEYVNSIYMLGSETRYDFDSAEEMLNYERALGYLNSVSTADKQYTIYVNKYTGVLYYVNNLTGQILTSNPYNYTDNDSDLVNQTLLSQVNIWFTEISTNKLTEDFNSAYEAALRGQISSSFINNGIRVDYALGDTTARFLLPGRMKADKYEALILVPMLTRLGELMEEYCGDIDFTQSTEKIAEVYNCYLENGYGFFDYESMYKFDQHAMSPEKPNEKPIDYNTTYSIYEYGCLNQFAYLSYIQQMKKLFTYNRKENPIGLKTTTPEYRELNTLANNIINLSSWIELKNPKSFHDDEDYMNDKAYNAIIRDYYTPSDSNKDCEIFQTLEPMYVYTRGEELSAKSETSIMFQKYAQDYTFADMFEDEQECGYVDKSMEKPVFRLSLEYTFNEDGSLNVRLPANSISFDETLYTLDMITPLEFFGVGNINEYDGYIFYPDGSGALLSFEHLRNMKIRANMASSVYGRDQCYSNIEIVSPPHAQISMPVYGVVTEDNANEFTKSKYSLDTVTNGYFAILEEGASLAQIGFRTGGAEHPYGGAYVFFEPYPSDQYDISESLSVGVSSKYTIVSESKYTGSYVMRYVMLADENINTSDKYYDASYVGMASYYRDYLEKNGVITALEEQERALPLYIEALGSMEVITKILSFPITQKMALTTFDQVLQMYNEISDTSKVSESFTATIAKYEELKANAEAMAEEMESEELASKYIRQAQSYGELVEKYKELEKSIASINNINFRLTGFGNGGLYYTYPTKVRWDSACGGKNAFNNLLSEAAKLTTATTNLGIYPEYDFLYINYTDLFDGITINGNVSLMVDNRYASKQVYDSISMEYVSNYVMVINPEALGRLYDTFIGQYSKYAATGISVSTLGSDLNSNFDEDMPVNRDDAESYVTDVLDKLKNDKGYDVMLDIGNIYSVEYADHILNASVDSSHFRFASNSIPFVGMILHGYVNYTGSPFNYSGAPDADLLRSIESGAAVYYILCYQNSNYLKDDIMLNDYYGIDYATWYDDIVLTYTELNRAIGDLQNYKITDHKFIIGERVIEEKEQIANTKLLEDEFMVVLKSYIEEKIDEAYDYLASILAPYGTPLSLTIDEDAVLDYFATNVLFTEVEELNADFVAAVSALCGEYESVDEYSSTDADAYKVEISDISYESKYSFHTDSEALDGDNYVETDYTSDEGNIVLVTYTNGTKTVQFILNYNIYTVNVVYNGVEYELGKNEYVRIG